MAPPKGHNSNGEACQHEGMMAGQKQIDAFVPAGNEGAVTAREARECSIRGLISLHGQ